MSTFKSEQHCVPFSPEVLNKPHHYYIDLYSIAGLVSGAYGLMVQVSIFLMRVEILLPGIAFYFFYHFLEWLKSDKNILWNMVICFNWADFCLLP